MSFRSSAPITDQSPVTFSDPLPSGVDVVIVGAGVIGIMSALYLRRAGLSVFVVEKGRVAGEQSSRNWGWIRQLGRDEAELPIMMEASRLWEQIDGDTGNRTGFRRTGIMYLASTDKEMEERAKWLDVARRHQLDVRAIDGDAVADRIDTGAGGKRWAGAVWSPTDARGEPWVAVPAVAQLAHSEGVGIRENCAIRTLETEAGKLSGVHTEHGFIAASQVVVAGGAWTSLLLRNCGVSLPQLSVRSTVMRTAPMPEVYDGAALDEELALRRREDGSYTVSALDAHDLLIGPDSFRHLRTWLPTAAKVLGQTRFLPAAPKNYPDAWGTARHWGAGDETPFERCRVLDPKPNASRTAVLKRRFAARFPSLGEPEITHAWAGMIDAMPDVVPVVDRVPGLEGLIVATGMSGHGFGIGPGFGKVVTNIATGRPTGHDISRFRFSRFTDGSKLIPGPAL
jgi:glycine/D-amino acid oxidase-like deaminating enzyme